MLVRCVSTYAYDLHELHIVTFVHYVIHYANEMPSVFRDYLTFTSELYEYNIGYKFNIHGHV
jgi:hypothetical protein